MRLRNAGRTAATVGRSSLWNIPAKPTIERPLDLFAFILGMGVLIHVHHAALDTRFNDIGIVVVILASCGLLLWPNRRALLLLLCGGIVVNAGFRLPGIENHWVLLGILSMGMIAVGVASTAQTGLAAREDYLERGVFALARLGLIAVFFIALLHKLNRGFFDTIQSCAVDHLNAFSRAYEIFPEVTGGGVFAVGVIGLTLVVELAIPVLLLMKRTRWAGVALGCVFHYFNAMNGHQGFSGAGLALYITFLPSGAWKALHLDGRSLLRQHLAVRGVQLVGLGLVAGGAILAMAGVTVELWWMTRLPYLLIVPVLAVAIGCWWFESARQSKEATRERAIEQPAPLKSGAKAMTGILVVTGLLVVGTGLLPYTGARSQLSYSMYSNLRVESTTRWNHWLIPSQVKFLGDDSDIVELVGLSTEAPDGLVAFPVFHERTLRNAVVDACATTSFSMTYRLEGSNEIVEEADACSGRFAERPNVLASKLLPFRPILEPNTCQW